MRSKSLCQKNTKEIRNPFDLEPEEESLISRYAKEEWDADFVFVTHYPTKKTPVLRNGGSAGSDIHTEL